MHWIFGGEAELNRMSASLHLGLGHWHEFTRGEANLQRDQINTCHHLGNRMLHLNAAVDLDEVRLPVGTDQEFKCAEIAIAGGTDRLGDTRQELFAHLWRECSRW